ncbi:MAG: hypothetical protein HC869_06550, partial [Rhodospirillales bacterium]|nr:hypothetical protein [Rhodospirillales bacterium]
LRDWKHLERLSLRGTKVTSEVFEHLAHITSLRSLDLGFTQIEDEGFEHLANLPDPDDLLREMPQAEDAVLRASTSSDS